MTAKFQITFDCASPERQVQFWATALHYQPQEPPAGFDTWRAYWLSIGIPEEELGDGDCADSLVDPEGAGPRIWFQRVPEGKVAKNRLHLDITVSGGRSVPLATRRERVTAEAERLIAAGATRLHVLSEPGVDHYGEVMQDPEGNEFCIN